MKNANYLIILIFSLLMIRCGTKLNLNKDHIQNWETLNIKGKVKTITAIQHRTKGEFGSFEKADEPETTTGQIYTFNERGFLMEKMDHYNFEKIVYTYDEKDRLIEKVTYGNNAVELAKPSDYSKAMIRVKYKYNADDQLIEQSTTNFEGAVIDFVVYEYSSNFFITKSKRKPVTKSIVDSKGQVVEIQEYRNKKAFENDEAKTKLKFKYDKNGNKIEESWGGGKRTFEYDENGYMTNRTSHLSNHDVRSRDYKYKLDEQGNWIWRSKRDHVFVYENVIEYF